MPITDSRTRDQIERACASEASQGLRIMPDRGTTHTVLHRFASTAYAGTRKIRVVRELLGHWTVATRQIYTEAPDDSIRPAVMTQRLGT